MRPVSGQTLDVVAVADVDDLHWNVVSQLRALLRSVTLRFNLADLRAGRLVADSECFRLHVEGTDFRVSDRTCVWWRRFGEIDTTDLAEDEARLALDEGPHLLIGAFDAVGARMVDHPFAVAKAEIKQWQLAIARRLGITIPATLVTNDADAAKAFAAGRRIVAKAVSPGTGIAPFVAEVFDSELDAVTTLPTMLQELVVARADLRIVVVGREAWIWRRPREEGIIDWRQIDPAGETFLPISNKELSIASCELTAAIGLSHSVQDWLETDDGPVFLESNAQGAWLFLAESSDLVASTLAQHLKATNE